ncbi:aspartate aminotransferase [Vibrio astriarenae]|nr:aspartate aminotransferase [Vibrio sp. C7]
MITTGSQQGLDLIARAYVNPGDKVVMEAPSYLGAMQVFGLVQANILTVSQTDFGPNLEELEQCFAEQKPKMFYAVPDFHNPTGVCWALETRQKVAELCIQYDVALIEDAPYRELRFSGEALPMVSDFCPQTLSCFVHSLRLLLRVFVSVLLREKSAIWSRLLKSNKEQTCTQVFQCKHSYMAC